MRFQKFLFTTLSIGSLSCSLLKGEEPNSTASFESRFEQLKEESDESEHLHHLFDLYWEWLMKINPDEATYLGYPKADHDKWPNISLEALKQNHEFSYQILEHLKTLSTKNLDKEEKVSHSILKRILEEDQASFSFGDQWMPVNQMFGIHLSIPLVMELMANKTLKDYQNILSRLEHIPELIEQVIALLEEGVEKGITQPRIAILGAPQQILNQIVENPLESPMLKAFQSFPSTIDEATQKQLLSDAKQIYLNKVIPALTQLHTYFIEKYLPNCRESIAFSDLPNGQEWYEHKIKSSTTTNLSAEEIHELGLKEVERIYQEMLEVIKQTSFKGSFKEFLQFMKTDPQFYFSNREDLLKGYQTLAHEIENKLPLLFAKLPKLPFQVVPIPSYSEESQVGAYYCSGSLADNRPGYFFINTSYPELRAKWEMKPLALHEAVPGHHLQIALAQELENLPEFRKNVHFTGYIEGWGLYAESLGFDLDLYQDPYSHFGRLSYEMLRAIRLVVDTGMHAMGWSREQAIEFFKKYEPMSNHEIETEVDRYLVLPGQALAYKIGELKILEMRQIAKEILGDDFDIRNFHTAWLEHGTIPLDIAEDNIHDWINTSQMIEIK